MVQEEDKEIEQAVTQISKKKKYWMKRVEKIQKIVDEKPVETTSVDENTERD